MPSDSQDQEFLLHRYDEAIRLARQWMHEEGRSQSWLAKQVGVDRSVLSRFLNRDAEVYTPGPNRRRILKTLEGIERVCVPRPRDIFLSHRTKDKDFVRQLAADIESHSAGDHRLLVWLDEAEIQPGHSIPALINKGLERSRFVALVMTPAYFEAGSGWTDAEWHSALHADPDNRRAKLLPLLAEDCPYIPTLLRHLLMIDFRGSKYAQGLEQLLRILRNEPLPRPVAYRGQLIESTGRIDRVSLLAERAIPEADPDVAAEKLYSNLLPIERLPQYVYSGRIADQHRKAKRTGSATALPTKKEVIEIVRAAQAAAGEERLYTPAFRIADDRIITFHDLEDPDGPLAVIVDPDDVEVRPTSDLLGDLDQRNLVVSLLNMALGRHLNGRGLVIDDTRRDRFFFPPKDGKPNIVRWRPMKRTALRTVAKPYERNGKPMGWIHQAATMRVVYLAAGCFVKITPTRVLTDDGLHVKGGPDVGKVVIRWLGQERNIHILYHVRFWTMMLRRGPGPTINVRTGDQFMEIRPLPAFVQQAYGLRDDRLDLLHLLDEEAQLISNEEEQDEALEIQLGNEELIADGDVIEAEIDDDLGAEMTEGEAE